MSLQRYVDFYVFTTFQSTISILFIKLTMSQYLAYKCGETEFILNPVDYQPPWCDEGVLAVGLALVYPCRHVFLRPNYLIEVVFTSS